MKAPVPNNFPAEGEHTPVTAAGVRQLEDQRPDQTATLDYTIGGTVEAEVHTTHEAARYYAINRGHGISHRASSEFEAEVEAASRKPLAVDFDLVKEQARAHIERQAQSTEQDNVQAP